MDLILPWNNLRCVNESTATIEVEGCSFSFLRFWLFLQYDYMGCWNEHGSLVGGRFNGVQLTHMTS